MFHGAIGQESGAASCDGREPPSRPSPGRGRRETASSQQAGDSNAAAPASACVSPRKNANTTTAVALTGDPALEGLQSLRLSFEYRDEPGRPWAQWTNLPLAFQGRPVDLSQREGIRLTLRTDGPRVVRVDLASRLYEAGVEGIKFGWEVTTSSEPLSVELRFADAGLPVWARATSDQLATIRARVDALSFQPMCNGREAGGGLLPEGTSDPGFLELDSIQVF